jgi:putative membrane protein
MNKLKKYWNEHQQQILIGIVAFMMLAGAVQHVFGLTYVLRLFPIFLAILTAIVLLVQDLPPRRKAAMVLIVVISGFLVELIGIHSGLIFGNYTYGSVMGYKIWGVPLTIGLTWLLVTLSAWNIVQYGKIPKAQKFILAGMLVVTLDLVLEQFAISAGLWAWSGGEIPIYNYVCWFLVGQMYFGLYNYLFKKFIPSIFVASLLPMMACFFWLMLLFG